MSFRLEITTGKSAGKSFYFKSRVIRVGRQPDNDLVLYDTGVSRHHCEIYAADNGYAVRDLGSSNGTFVNSQLVGDSAVNDGDLIQVGPIVFSFRGGEDIDQPTDIEGFVHFSDDDDFDSMENTCTTAFELPPGLDVPGNQNRTFTGSYISRRRRSRFMGSMTQKVKTTLLSLM